jgi:hypothetical protein
VRAGLADRIEVKQWSIPKIQLWLILIEEAQVREALILSAAVWDGKKAEEAIGASRASIRELLGLEQKQTDWTPPTWDLIQERLKKT